MKFQIAIPKDQRVIDLNWADEKLETSEKPWKVPSLKHVVDRVKADVIHRKWDNNDVQDCIEGLETMSQIHKRYMNNTLFIAFRYMTPNI